MCWRWKVRRPAPSPEQQVLDALGEEELTAMILDLREPYRTPCRLVLLEQHTMAEAGTAVRPSAQDGGSTDLPGKKDAGTADTTA